MATESTAAAAELVSADKIEDVPAPSTSADKVESDEVSVSLCCLGWSSSHLLTSASR
uniref:Nuclear autoantigenic sperm protein n=1 Tax=Callithrix jacchus TaxID=9483 RepID=A0A2R8NDN0_CALJA